MPPQNSLSFHSDAAFFAVARRRGSSYRNPPVPFAHQIQQSITAAQAHSGQHKPAFGAPLQTGQCPRMLAAEAVPQPILRPLDPEARPRPRRLLAIRKSSSLSSIALLVYSRTARGASGCTKNSQQAPLPPSATVQGPRAQPARNISEYSPHSNRTHSRFRLGWNEGMRTGQSLLEAGK